MKNINIKKIDIKKIPKEALIAAGGTVLLVIFFLIFVYVPTGRRIRDLRNEAAAVSNQIKEIRVSMAGAKSVDEALASMNKKLAAAEALFPTKEDAILGELSNVATGLGVEVISMSPQKKRVIKDIDGVPVSVTGKFIKETPVTMSLRGRYKSVGDLVIKLRGDFPMLVKVDTVDMSSSGREDGALNVNLQLNSYMLSDTAE